MGHHLFGFSVLYALLAFMAAAANATEGPGTEIQPGYFWVRAVKQESKCKLYLPELSHVLLTKIHPPDYHKYIQTKPLLKPGPAILGDYTTAGQFAVQKGHLIQLISASNETANFLYGSVPYVTDPNRLAVKFSAEAPAKANFVFEGDSLIWSDPSVKRQQQNAWLVCGDGQLFLNRQAWGSKDKRPADCDDHTVRVIVAHGNNADSYQIHYYKDKYAKP